ncbi:MAG TPA: M48 family metalloprotease [Actinomycetota bacterium]|nr:M48 family metalloprotease [Actinomycetota bacterium]
MIRRASGGGWALLLVSLLLDIPSALLRLVLASVVLGLFAPLGVWTDALAALAAAGPLVRSLAAVALPIPAGPLYRAALGARQPSERERAELERSRAWLPTGPVLVVDSPDENAWVLGATLFVTRGLFASPHLDAVVAHEAGHLRAGDGRIALAAWWLPIRSIARLGLALLGTGAGVPRANIGRALPGPVRQPGGGAGRGPLGALVRLPARIAGVCLLAVSGGLLPALLRPAWIPYRRSREYAADRFAASVGQAPALIEALADWQMVDVAAPWWQGRSHPYAEQRIDRLQEGTGR